MALRSNRAAALRWLAANVGATLDTVQTDAAGTVRWIPGPRVLTRPSATRYAMVGSDAARPSYMSTDSANRFYVRGDTLTIESMASMTSGPSGVAEVWHITHYSIRTDAAFVAVAAAYASVDDVCPECGRFNDTGHTDGCPNGL